jgi:hypothetical protein
VQAQNPRGQKLRPVRIIVFLSYKFNKLSNLAAAKVDIIFDIGEFYFIKYPSNKCKNGCHLPVYSRLFFDNPWTGFIQKSLPSPLSLGKDSRE